MRRNILDFIFVHIVANGVTTAKKGKCKIVESEEKLRKHHLLNLLQLFLL